MFAVHQDGYALKRVFQGGGHVPSCKQAPTLDISAFSAPERRVLNSSLPPTQEVPFLFGSIIALAQLAFSDPHQFLAPPNTQTEHKQTAASHRTCEHCQVRPPLLCLNFNLHRSPGSVFPSKSALKESNQILLDPFHWTFGPN